MRILHEVRQALQGQAIHVIFPQAAATDAAAPDGDAVLLLGHGSSLPATLVAARAIRQASADRILIVMLFDRHGASPLSFPVGVWFQRKQ